MTRRDELPLNQAEQHPQEVHEVSLDVVGRVSGQIKYGSFEEGKREMDRLRLADSARQTILQRAIQNVITDEDFESAQRIITEYQVPEATQHAAVEMAMLIAISDTEFGGVRGAKRIAKRFNVPDTVGQAAAQKAMAEVLYERGVSAAVKVAEAFSLSAEQRVVAVETGLVECLENGDKKSLEIANKFDLAEEFLQSEPVQTAATAGVMLLLIRGEPSVVVKLIKQFKLSPVVLTSPEAEKAIVDGLRDASKGGGKQALDNVLKFAQGFRETSAGPCRRLLNLEAVQTFAVSSLSEALWKWSVNIEGALRIVAVFEIPAAVVSAEAESAMISSISDYSPKNALDIANSFGIAQDKRQAAAQAAMQTFIGTGDIQKSLTVADTFELPDTERQTAVQAGMIIYIRAGEFKKLSDLIKELNPTSEFLASPQFIEATQTGIAHNLTTKPNFPMIDQTVATLQLPEAVAQVPARTALVHWLQHADGQKVLDIVDHFELNQDNTPSDDVSYIFFDETVPRDIRLSSETYQAGVIARDQRARLSHAISPEDHQFVRVNQANLAEAGAPHDEAGYAAWATALIANERKRDSTIGEAMQKCVETFGDRYTLEYTSRVGMRRHDALEFFPALLKVYQHSGVPQQGFAELILLQVARDDAAYDTGTAHHQFAAVCRRLQEVDTTGVLTEARSLTGLPQLGELVDQLSGERAIFSSWKMLRKFSELVEILEQRELLEELASSDISPRLQAYITKLAFHPNVDGKLALQFWRDTATFLDIDDLHTESSINAVKKPSNYLTVPNLGLAAEDLRDAVVEGSLDKLQILPPMQRDMRFGTPLREDIDATDSADVHYALRCALGQRSEGVAGKAANARQVFDQVRRFCKANTIEWNQLWEPATGPAIISTLPAEVRGQLLDTIFSADHGIRSRQDNDSYQMYRMTLGLKSDPDMVVAGNDTASCMPFGAGKSNVYLFNPNCAQAVVQRRTSAGQWRTAAQSVMTIDMPMSRTISALVERYNEVGD